MHMDGDGTSGLWGRSDRQLQIFGILAPGPLDPIDSMRRG